MYMPLNLKNKLFQNIINNVSCGTSLAVYSRYIGGLDRNPMGKDWGNIIYIVPETKGGLL